MSLVDQARTDQASGQLLVGATSLLVLLVGATTLLLSTASVGAGTCLGTPCRPSNCAFIRTFWNHIFLPTLTFLFHFQYAVVTAFSSSDNNWVVLHWAIFLRVFIDLPKHSFQQIHWNGLALVLGTANNFSFWLTHAGHDVRHSEQLSILHSFRLVLGPV